MPALLTPILFYLFLGRKRLAGLLYHHLRAVATAALCEMVAKWRDYCKTFDLQYTEFAVAP